MVRDVKTLLPVAAATVEVSGRLHTTQTTHNGEFWRLLLPGTYVIKVSCLLSILSHGVLRVRFHSTFLAAILRFLSGLE